MSISGASARSIQVIPLAAITISATILGGYLGVSHAWVPNDPLLEAEIVGPADVIHNPPLLLASEDELALDFRYVCAWSDDSSGECQPSGTVHVTDASGDTHELPLTPANSSAVDLRTVVPHEIVAEGPLTYRATFAVDGDEIGASWPTDSTSGMSAWTFANPTLVALSSGSEALSAGELVHSGSWGSKDTQYGRSSEGFGPSSFDVTRGGDLWVVDQENARVAIASQRGARQNIALDGLARGTPPDIAVEDSGAFTVLYPNGGDLAGSAAVEQYSLTGQFVDRRDIAAKSAANIRVIGQDLVAWNSGQQQWLRLSSGGRAESVAEQQRSARPGRPAGEGRQVIVKHAGDHEVRVAVVGRRGVEQAWSLRSREFLGHIELANVTGDEVVVVVSEFNNNSSRFHIVRLGEAPPSDVITPDQRYGEMTARSIFRLGHDAIYQARSTTNGFGIYRYSMRGVQR